MQELILQFLLDSQNSDGSWGYFPGKVGAMEPTAYACLSLDGVSTALSQLQRGIEFIRVSQSPQGGWPVNRSDNQPTAWTTALTGLALIQQKGTIAASQMAASFLIDSAEKTPRPWMLRVAEWMQSWDPSYVNQNKKGWNWNSGTATWIEPTAYSLIFLKKFRAMGGKISGADESKMMEISRDANQLIYSRSCKDGGWNYGNSQVLGEELRAYPLTTALALIAIQDNPDRIENRKGLEFLERSMETEKSALALSFAALCLQVYESDITRILARIQETYEENLFFSNIRTAALASLAWKAHQGKNCFKF